MTFTDRLIVAFMAWNALLSLFLVHLHGHLRRIEDNTWNSHSASDGDA